MPYIELRNYTDAQADLSEVRRNGVMEIVRNHLTRGQEIDGTFEFRHLKQSSSQDYCEYEYILVIDMGWSEDREARMQEIAKNIGKDLEPVLGTDSFAVRLRLQNAAFVPYE
jgi:hypothetical protein